MQLEPCTGLDTAERRLVNDFRPAGFGVTSDVVHDLEGWTTREVQIDVIVVAFADGQEDVRAVVGLVYRLDLWGQLGSWSWDPVYGVICAVFEDRSRALSIGHLKIIHGQPDDYG